MGQCVHKGIISAVKSTEFVNIRLLYVILIGRWCDIIVQNVPSPAEVKTGDTKDSFYDELEHVFSQFSQDNMKIS